MLAPADIEVVHAAAVRVLARTGVAIHDDEAVNLLRAHGARVDSRRVFIDEGAVQAALAAAPPAFTLAGRNPARDVRFGDSRPVIGTASGPAYVLDGDAVRPGTLDDARAVAKLGRTRVSPLRAGPATDWGSTFTNRPPW